MGVTGLTRYILQYKQECLVDYELAHNSILILDGDSVAANIFIQCLGKKTCFGGDYEIYAKGILNFFTMLLDCKITPYVLLNGAVEERKLKTKLNHLEQRIEKSLKVNCTNEEKHRMYPLFLWPVFKDVLHKLSIPMVICDYKCDGDVADIAKQLDFPVLSYNSEFFIFDIAYIPFYLDIKRDKPNLFMYRKLDINRKTGIRTFNINLRCKIFDREKFFSSTKLMKPLLPILAVFLSNDFVGSKQDFFEHLKIKKKFRNNLVEAIIKCLADKPVQKACDILLQYIEAIGKSQLKGLALETIDYYRCYESKYLKYFIEDELEDCTLSSSAVSKIILEKCREGFYHHHFLNILWFQRYFPRPLVDRIDRNHSHTSSFNIIDAIHGILTNASGVDLLFYGRVGYKLCGQIVPKYNQQIPTYEEVQNMSLKKRLKVFLDILNVKHEFSIKCLKLFPTSWQLLLITLKYVSQVTTLEVPFIKSLVLSKIVISYVDKKIGIVRTLKDFEKYSKYLSSQTRTSRTTSLARALDAIDFNDSIAAIRELIPYFEVSDTMKRNPNFFDRNLLHLMSEFQSCFLHIDMLNDLFNRPFEKCSMSDIFNGTFIYILYFELRYKNVHLIENMLRKSPVILNCFQHSISLMENQITAI